MCPTAFLFPPPTLADVISGLRFGLSLLRSYVSTPAGFTALARSISRRERTQTARPWRSRGSRGRRERFLKAVKLRELFRKASRMIDVSRWRLLSRVRAALKPAVTAPLRELPSVIVTALGFLRSPSVCPSDVRCVPVLIFWRGVPVIATRGRRDARNQPDWHSASLLWAYTSAVTFRLIL